MHSLAVVYFKGLRDEYGITTCRTHLNRLMDAGKFPACHRQQDSPKSRRYWFRSDIEAWLKGEWK
jgi:hypothetical protein